METNQTSNKREVGQIIVLGVGMPGSGKTTLLKPFADNNDFAYINRDDICVELFGNARIQTDKNIIWDEATRRVKEAFESGRSVVYDSTLAEKLKRVELIAAMKKMGWKRVFGFYMNTSFAIAKERNRNRTRVVPETELEKFFIEPLTKSPPSTEDGFDKLYTLDDLEEFKLIFSQQK